MQMSEQRIQPSLNWEWEFCIVSICAKQPSEADLNCNSATVHQQSGGKNSYTLCQCIPSVEKVKFAVLMRLCWVQWYHFFASARAVALDQQAVELPWVGHKVGVDLLNATPVSHSASQCLVEILSSASLMGNRACQYGFVGRLISPSAAL